MTWLVQQILHQKLQILVKEYMWSIAWTWRLWYFTICKTESACSDINAQFRNNTVRKMYIAQVQGAVEKDTQKILTKLRADVDNPPFPCG